MPNTLEDKDWERLLQRIKDGKCTPFLGAGVSAGKIPVGSQIASEWAKKYDYPMEDSYDLTRVAQYVAVTEEDEMVPRDEICKRITELSEEITPKYFETPNEIHGVLADLQLPIYITTNYDDLMERALKSRRLEPIQEICWWNEELMDLKPKLSDFTPTPEKPLVYHLHGTYEIPESLVLTEDNYLDFLVAISMDQKLLPPLIQAAFTRSSLLLIGYKITDWDFRVLLRILHGYLKKSLTRKHISVQLVPGNVFETQKETAQNYLDKYFKDLNIHVYWHDCCEFAAELKARWEAFNRDITKIDTEKRCSFPIKEETKKFSILFLAADPTGESRLRLGQEFREIDEQLRLAKLRENFKLEQPQLSLRPRDITGALLNIKPQIVHFAGHGTAEGALCFEDETGQALLIQPEALTALFEQFTNQVKCVVLNACYSEIQANAIAKHIKYVIGMNQAISDKTAIDFAIGFYQALGGGRNIEDAYKLGCVQIQLNIPEHLMPILIKEGSVVNVTAQQNND